MLTYFKTKLIALTIMLILANGQVQAKGCPRCMKIEQERAKEQADHPQKSGYYDDQTLADQSNKLATSNNKPLNNAQDMDSIYFNELNQPQTGLQYGSSVKESDSDTDAFKQKLKADDSQLIPNGKGWQNEQNDNSQQVYSTAYNIIQTDQLLQTLNGPFTVFIPSNEALRKLPPGTVQDLLRPENRDKLAAIISNHIVATKIEPNDLKTKTIKTISGQYLNIRTNNDSSASVNGARILKSDQIGSNGMIYIIDSVLM